MNNPNQKNIKSIRADNKINNQKPDNSVKIVSVISLLLLLSFFVFNYGKQIFSSVFLSLPSEQKIEVKIDPFQQKLQSVILKYNYNTLSLGNDKSIYLDLNIQNNNSKTISNFEISCRTDTGNPSTNVDFKKTIFEEIPANTLKEIKQFNFYNYDNEFKQLNCLITDVNLK